jgi:hypothetical protein
VVERVAKVEMTMESGSRTVRRGWPEAMGRSVAER